MGLKLLRYGRMEAPLPKEAPGVGVSGKQLLALCAPWPELRVPSRRVGLYHALGREKIDVHEAFYDGVEQGGFDSFRTSALVFEHMTLGPFAQLAIAREFQGPFWTLESDELSGSLALATAAADLERGRCELALVGAYERRPARARLLLLAYDPSEGVEVGLCYTHGRPRPDASDRAALATRLGVASLEVVSPDRTADPHGLDTLAELLESGEAPSALWSCTTDGRGLLVGLRRHP